MSRSARFAALLLVVLLQLWGAVLVACPECVDLCADNGLPGCCPASCSVCPGATPSGGAVLAWPPETPDLPDRGNPWIAMTGDRQLLVVSDILHIPLSA